MRNLEVSGHISEPVAREYIAYALLGNPNLEACTACGFDIEFVDFAEPAKQNSAERLARVVSCNQERTIVAVAIVAPDTALIGTMTDETVFEIQDFVCSHGFGDATEAGIKLALELIAQGDDVATAAAEVVVRGLTEDAEA